MPSTPRACATRCRHKRSQSGWAVNISAPHISFVITVHGIRFSTTSAVKPSAWRCGKLRCVGLIRGSLLTERSEAPRVTRFARNELSAGAELLELSATSAQAQQGDYAGAAATHATIEPSNGWHDIGTDFMIRELLSRGDRAVAEALVTCIHDSEIRSSAIKLLDPPLAANNS